MSASNHSAPALLALVAGAAMTTCTPAHHSPLPRSLDPAGCVVEDVIVIPGEDHFGFRGLSPDGRWLAVGWSGGADSAVGTYLLDLNTRDRRTLPGLNNGASFSPDGRWVVSATNVGGRNTEIIEHHLTTGRSETIAPDPAPDFLPSYSPDGQWIVFNSYRTGRSDLYLYHRTDRSLRRLTTFEGYEAHAQFSPDGRQIVFHREVSRGDYNLVLLDLRTNQERMLTTGPGEESYPAFSPDGGSLVYSADRPEQRGATNLHVLSLGSETSRPLTTQGARDGYATWSVDGRYIYFTSRRSGRIGLYRLPMRGGACERVE